VSRLSGIAGASYAALLYDLTGAPDRRTAVRALAQALGTTDLLLFLRDPELDVLLPAPGFPQTLPDGRAWQAFLRRCVEARVETYTDSDIESRNEIGSRVNGDTGNDAGDLLTAHLRPPGAAESVDVMGLASGRDTVLVLWGGVPRREALMSVTPLLPLVARALAGEQSGLVADAHARVARDAANRAEALAKSLDTARAELQHALDEARESRRLVELQATELQAANKELEAQAEELQMSNEELAAQTEVLETTTEALHETNERLTASEQQLRTLADAIPTLAWTAKADGYVDWYNQGWYDYTGTTLEEMCGWGWQSVHDPDQLPQVLARWKASIASGTSFEMEFPLRGGDGVFRWFLTRIVPVMDNDGHVARWFGTNTNIDEQRSVSEALKEARAAAEVLQKAAEAANQAKSDFLANMSHELRTPLNAIGGYVQLIELGIHGPVTDAQRTALDRVQRSQQHLLLLINDVLNFAKLEAGHVDYAIENVRLADAVEDVMSMVEPLLAARGLTYEVHLAPDVVVRADGDKLRQILLNLLSNAVKFTERGGRITVSTAVREERQDSVAFLRVSDTGCGIPRDQQEAVFDPFVQVPRGHSRATEGTGLGLAISRDLARGMDGDIRVRSEDGEGSVLTVTLPRVSDGEYVRDGKHADARRK
jgi:PAS domain S-box-containing protein